VLQVFTGIAAVTSLVLGAAVAERNRAIRLRDEFISIASHELKTPLTPLKLQVQMLRRLLESGSLTNADPQRISRMAMTSERQIDRLQRLVADMLDVSRARSGRFTLEREAFDLAALARDTLETFEAELTHANSQADLHFDIPVVGTWDRLRIQQVIANLVGNAIKFGRGLPISVSVDAEPDRARLIVEDHGLGIALDDQARIFNRFERAVAARHFAGLGLGLYIARQIVDAHGGTIRVESTPESGSRFIVELPL
jgi:signal transduction histidine kinase